jgi:nucleotide-binding universal stress UspA family protein
MSLADILVHIDNTPNCSARLDVAIRLAQRHKASLTGLYVIAHKYYEPRQQGTVEAAAASAKQLFDDRTTGSGVEALWHCVDWSVIGVSVAEIINHHAHYTDLVVVGQTLPGAAGKGFPADLPERLILGAGRPVLVVPYAGNFPNMGGRILVAWKAGRESTRAVNDALPLLKAARQVNLLAVNSSANYGDDSESLCANICLHLSRHGVIANAEKILAATASVGDTLLNRAYEEGFDLLVMGAYAHTPQGTLVLGAVAKHLLKDMTVPVLMSH